MSAPISWAALANKKKDAEVTIMKPAESTNSDILTSINFDPLLADADEDALFVDIQEQWKSDPFNAFKQGVAVTFLLWSALQIIIQQELVQDADTMSDILEFDTIEFFIESKGKVSPEELADFFDYTISRQFFTVLDDNSCAEVAKILCTLYDDCVRKRDFTGLEELLEQAQKLRLESDAQIATRIPCSDDEETDGEYWDEDDDDYEDGGDYFGDEDDEQDYVTTTTAFEVDQKNEEKQEFISTTTTTTEKSEPSKPEQPIPHDIQPELSQEQTEQERQQKQEDEGWSSVKSNPRARPLRAKKPKKGAINPFE